VSITQVVAGVTYKQQMVLTATAAAAATSLAVASFAPAVAYTTAATLVSASQGEVGSFVEAGCTVSSLGAQIGGIRNPTELAEAGSRLALSMVHAIQSAGVDTFGVQGVG
jgi:hypothetical protein